MPFTSWLAALRRRDLTRPAASHADHPARPLEADLRAALPPDLVAALPDVELPAMFVAYTQAKARPDERHLVRHFGLTLRQAKTVVAFATDDEADDQR